MEHLINTVHHADCFDLLAIITPSPQRECSKCGVEYPATLEYFKKSRKKDRVYLSSWCRVCLREYNRQWHAENAEKENQKTRQWRVENAEKVLEQQRRYRAANQDRRREYRRQWGRQNPEKTREHARRRRTIKANLPSAFRVEHERIALNYFNGCCAVCGRQLRDLFGTHTAAMDHWIPLSKGGGTTLDNMIPLCHGVGGCNNSKHNNTPAEWLSREFTRRKRVQILTRINEYFEWCKEQV